MTVVDPLSLPLGKELPETAWPVVAENLWNLHHPILQSRQQAYLQELYEQYFGSSGFFLQQYGLFSYGQCASAKTYRDVVRVAEALRKPVPREQALQAVAKLLGPADQSRHNMTINLVVRLMLMLKVGAPAHECVGRNQLEWRDGTTLAEFVRANFRKPRRRKHERLKLERTFKAVNLRRIAGVNIKWTDNLAEHLQMMNDDKMVAVFRHASFLKAQRFSALYPRGLIDETLQTLELLFPQDDPATKKWFAQVSKTSHPPLDRHLIRVGTLWAEARDFDNFRFWHDRLVTLKQVYNEARPETISQWWYDRRHPTEWYTVWTAVLVIVLTCVFGFAQCILGAMQVYLTVKGSSS